MRLVSRKKMMCIKPLFWAFLLCSLSSLYGEEENHPVTPIDKPIGKQWAVFIAIDQYAHWENLSNAVQDAQEIRDILMEQYLIHEVRELYNSQAAARNIRNLFAELQRQTGSADSIFLFYAGYGQTDKFSQDGYWIPADAEKNPSDKERHWLSNREMQDLLSALPAKHIFLISDACFSGEGLVTKQEPIPQFAGDYYNHAYSKVSRQVLTSGAIKAGPSSAEFAARLKNALRQAEGPYMDPLYLFTKIYEVKATRPLLGVIKGREEQKNFLSRNAFHQDGGSFLFFKLPLSIDPGIPYLFAAPPIFSNPVIRGNMVVTLEIPDLETAGILMIQGVETETSIKAKSSVMIRDIPIGDIEVGVKLKTGELLKAFRRVEIQEGQTAPVVIERSWVDRFVRIPGGTFMMGTPGAEPGSDEIQHEVRVGDFYMKKHEVNREEFQQFIQETGYQTQTESAGGGYIWTEKGWSLDQEANWQNPQFPQPQERNHPVVLVTWYDAIRFCNWLSEREGLVPAYTLYLDTVSWNKEANGYRLPTEAEWEYAARAGTKTPFSTGNTLTDMQAQFNAGMTAPEKEFPANPWGLYDMHGNVWEWCWDRYDKTYASEEEEGASFSDYRVRRGGSWRDEVNYLRSAYRSYSAPDSGYNSTGFRLVRSIP